MIALATAHPAIGVVNPASSTFGEHPPAGIALQAYADQRRRFRGRYAEVGMCIGFCMLIKREVLDRIGGLSEEVERIFFEDEDFCMRAQQVGYQCVVAEAAYVYHAEHKTVRKMPEREALFAKNKAWCDRKWGRRIRIAWPCFRPLTPGSDELRQWLERLIAWTRRRTHVYVYCPTPPGLTKDELFRSVGLIPHADIHWRPIARALAPLPACTHIMMRRTKPFAVSVTSGGRWGRVMEQLRLLHGAEVVPEQDESQLLVQWKQRSRVRL